MAQNVKDIPARITVGTTLQEVIVATNRHSKLCLSPYEPNIPY